MSAAKTPTVAVARVLRGLGLKQGEDFRVTGFYQSRQRTGTFVILFNRYADKLVSDRADDIERLTSEAGYPFRVSVTYPNGRPVADVKNFGSRVREAEPVREVPSAAVTAEVPADVLALKGRSFEREDRVYANGRVQTVIRRAEVLKVLPDFVNRWENRKPAPGVLVNVSSRYGLVGYRMAMHAGDFRKLWLDGGREISG